MSTLPVVVGIVLAGLALVTLAAVVLTVHAINETDRLESAE